MDDRFLCSCSVRAAYFDNARAHRYPTQMTSTKKSRTFYRRSRSARGSCCTPLYATGARAARHHSNYYMSTATASQTQSAAHVIVYTHLCKRTAKTADENSKSSVTHQLYSTVLQPPHTDAVVIGRAKQALAVECKRHDRCAVARQCVRRHALEIPQLLPRAQDTQQTPAHSKRHK